MLALLYKKCDNELHYLLILYVSDTACTVTSEASHVTFFNLLVTAVDMCEC